LNQQHATCRNTAQLGGQTGATCCEQQCCDVALTCCDRLAGASSLKMVKFEPTTPNMSQHGATGRTNARNMLRPTILRYVALTCCDRLAGALKRILGKKT